MVDASVLLYAVNESAEHHDEARGWLDGVLNGRATVGFSRISLLAFRATVDEDRPSPLHCRGQSTRPGGNLSNDAHLAALAIEHRGEVVTYDSDFGRKSTEPVVQ